MKDVFVVIPTLDPDEKIMSKFLNDLKKEFENILVINDGCNESFDKFFKKIKNDNIIIFNHYKNLGKGRALKNAFNYILDEYPNILGVVTCDSDGQHSVKDIKRCAEELLNNPDELILGTRNFDEGNVPKKSKLGNKLTRNVFKIFIGMDITDTQTGLRAMSRDLMYDFLDVIGERYEYESNMLIACKELNISIREVEIDTIYIDDNSTSHFNPVKDSIKIYKLFISHLLWSLSTYILDIIIFLAVFNILNINSKVLASTIIARIISTFYNYLVNRRLKFRNFSGKVLSKYYILTIIQMFISGCFIAYIYNLTKGNILLIKLIIDLFVWIVNIFIQAEFKIDGDNNE